MKRKKNHILTVLFIILVIFTLASIENQGLTMVKSASANHDEIEVHFLDVSHGDSILIRYPYGKVVLIDAGKEEYGGKIISHLESMGIKRIDYLIASHYDMDHIGGMPAVLDNFKVEKFYGPYYREELKKNHSHYNKLVDKLYEKNVVLELANAGMKFKIDGVDNYILAPVKDSYKYPNDHSIVMKTVYKRTSILFTGDLQFEGEKEVIKKYGKDLDADVLKVGHHGYKGSTNKSFLKVVKPRISIISGGDTVKAPRYSNDVYNRLEKSGTKIYTTLDNGNIILTSDGNDIGVKIQRGE